MTALDSVIATPRLVEIDRVDLSAPPAQVWQRMRHAALAHSPVTRALFALRTLVDRAGTTTEPPRGVRIDDLTSSSQRPGFQVLVDDPPREVVVGAIGQVWRPRIPFVHVDGADAFAAFAAPGYVKVAWAIRLSPLDEGSTHLELEVRVSATDDAAWRRFGRYFLLIGPASRYIRRSLLRALGRELGRAEPGEDRPLAGDERLPDATRQLTHRVDIAATAAEIWPWLVQMGCRRGGFYSIDALDNGGRRSAREIHPELQGLAAGDVIPATPDGAGGFEVLDLNAPHALVLGGLYDRALGRQLPFAAARPERFWHVTWAFALQPLDGRSTRLTVRVRGAFAASERWRARWIPAAHRIMEAAQLRQLAARAEGRLPRDDWRDVVDGVGGAMRMAWAFLTPFLRGRRDRWGFDRESAARPLPGDELVPTPGWSWTHGVEIDAPPAAVWPWVAQIGADRGGFYSYQWLENLAGCRLRNAERIHPEWQVRPGGRIVLHPAVPALPIAAVDSGRFFVAHAPASADAVAAGAPWVAISWLFLVEPLDRGRSRFVSRYRVACSDSLRARLAFGPALVEPIGAEMDRRMLLGVKARAERRPPMDAAFR
ncbi:MAG: hypothetical protein ACHQRO_05775 [Vicinamibacteria bacterium]